MIFRPAGAWEALRAADPAWTVSLLRHALPLSLLPAIAWPLGQGLSGDLAFSLEAVGVSFLATVGVCIASILLLAAGFYLLAPFFEVPRVWRRAVAVAAFAGTPVLLSGVLLVLPVLILASVAAAVHCFALCYLGVQRMLGCAERDAAFFVAGACMFALVGSLVVGGLCSAAGVL